MIQKIIKVQQLSHFVYRFYDILHIDEPRPSIYNYEHRNYVQDYDPSNKELVQLWSDFGFNPHIEYLKVNFKNSNVVDWYSFLKIGHPLNGNLVLPTNASFDDLGWEHDFSSCFISRPNRGEMYQNFSIVEKKYIYKSLIIVLKCIDTKYTIMLPVLMNYFLKFIDTFDKDEIYSELKINKFLDKFLSHIDLFTKMPDIALIFDTYAYFIMSLSSIDHRCFQEVYHNIHPLYKDQLESWHAELQSQYHLELPRKCHVGESHDKMDRHRQKLVYNNDVIKNSIYDLRDICLLFLQKEKALYKHLNIPHYTNTLRNHLL